VPPRSTHFIQSFCDRCGVVLPEGRMMSFFLNETICPKCSQKEEEIRAKIRHKASEDADLVYQGCGFLPRVKGENKIFKNLKSSKKG
jgi:hypothetical protein